MKEKKGEKAPRNVELTEVSTFRPFGTGGGYSEIDEHSENKILRTVEHDIIMSDRTDNPTVREGFEDLERHG